MSEQTVKSAFTMEKANADLYPWMDGHHHVEPGSGDAPMHVFAQTADGGPVYGPDAQPSESGYDIQVPLKAVALQAHVIIDFSTLGVSADLGYALPFHPTVHLAGLRGNLRDGLTVRVGGLVQGEVSLSFADQWLKMRFDGSVLGEKSVFDIKLVPTQF
ncbi:hypothetical protein [Nocardiopsis sp. CA-288880]|uniref:hypothetical protein n=1 Tax=Nocardiopsis sp. CA-288880 TaxID=3239995 RepID=UPI003D9984B6